MAADAALYDWLMPFHIPAAMIWLGGAVAIAALAAQTLRAGEGDAVARFVNNMRVVGPVLFVPALLAVLGLGIWLVLDSGEWGFGQTWVWLALALFAAAFVVATIFQGRAALGAQRAVPAGDQIEPTRQLRRWAWGLGLIIALLVSITWDMVIKPGF